MSTNFQALRRWEIPGLVRIEPGAGGLAKVAISTALAQAEIYLHGAHVTHYQPKGQSPVLFLSAASLFAPDKAIRGGVPVIFPWFGAYPDRPDLPMHGLVRTREWELERVEKRPDETIEVLLRTFSDEATCSLWPHDFVLRHRVTVGRELEMRLEVENWSEGAFTYEEALHTYLAVRDVKQVTVSGLSGADYLDKTDALRRKTQEGAIKIEAETDRVYLDTTAACLADDPVGGRRLRVSKEGSSTTVVWNPWIEKAAALKDFGNDEWPSMLCIETANASTGAVTLQPRETHTMAARVAADLVI